MKKSKTKRRCPMLLRVLLRLALLGFVLWTALVAFVCVKEYTVPKPDGTTQAIIVLGAQVKPDGTLSLQLQYRMELALEQYRAHPQVIVVCGAQGGNEPMTEAQAMHDYLVSNGVPEGDILMDDTSFNTRQNLTNAQKLLGDDVKKVLIVTSNYHLPRAMALARDTGFEPQGVGAPIKLIYWPKNHYREALAWGGFKNKQKKKPHKRFAFVAPPTGFEPVFQP